MIGEIGRYKKKRQSSTSKSKNKTKHKHHYKGCLIRYSYESFGKKYSEIKISSYCTICGKIGKNIDKNRKLSEDCGNGYYRMLRAEEIVKNNSDLPIFDVGNWYERYVSF